MAVHATPIRRNTVRHCCAHTHSMGNCGQLPGLHPMPLPAPPSCASESCCNGAHAMVDTTACAQQPAAKLHWRKRDQGRWWGQHQGAGPCGQDGNMAGCEQQGPGRWGGGWGWERGKVLDRPSLPHCPHTCLSALCLLQPSSCWLSQARWDADEHAFRWASPANALSSIALSTVPCMC